jgi:hypothetical protein
MSKLAGKFLVGLVPILAVFCSISTPQNATPTLSPPTVDQPVVNTVTLPVSATQGGTLALPDGASVHIPPGALPKDSKVTIQTIQGGGPTPTLTDTTTTVGKVYEIRLGTEPPQQDVELEIPFDPTLLPEGAQADQVFLTTFDEKTGAWLYAGGVPDLTRHVIKLSSSHASFWKPATWNWAAWSALLGNNLKPSAVTLLESFKLLTAGCQQTGQYVRVEMIGLQNLVQGCIDKDDPRRPVLRLVNPRVVFYEVSAVSGGAGYPEPSLLGPGASLSFSADTNDPSPLVVKAMITKKSTGYLLIHMVIAMLPGLDYLQIPNEQIVCLTERLADVGPILDAVEALFVSHDGLAAAESLGKFYLDNDAMRRLIKGADDCQFNAARTWDIKGLGQLGAAVSTMMSSTDYIASFLSGNVDGEVAFHWVPVAKPTVAPTQTAVPTRIPNTSTPIPTFKAHPTQTPRPAKSSATPTQHNSICGWIDSYTGPGFTGVFAPILIVWGTNEAIDLDLLDDAYLNQLKDLGMPGYFRVYDPVFGQFRIMTNISRIEKVSSCK